jgi:hypothetical protein
MASPEIHNAILAHSVWKSMLLAAVEIGRSDLTLANVLREDQCDFGRWLLALPADGPMAQSEHFRRVRLLHTEFHACAGEVLLACREGDQEGARALMSEGSHFMAASRALTQALREWDESSI